MSVSPSLLAQLADHESRALAAERQGRLAEALISWREVLQLKPDHPRALLASGFDAHQRGDLAGARELYTRAAQLTRDDPTPWINVARICKHLKDDAGEEQALFEALTVDASDLLALLMRGQLFERQGRTREAARAYTAACMVAPPPDRLRPDLRPMLAHAKSYRDRQSQHMAEQLDQALAPAYAKLQGADLDRFKLSLDIMLGRRQRFDAKPAQYYLPHVPAIEFFDDRRMFPWIADLEAGTEDIRQEFLKVLDTDEGFTPYIHYDKDLPLNQWVELNHSPRWSAYHLIKDGVRHEPGASRCPRTMELLARAPQPDQPGRTPVALFSLLKPKTRIPPHTGVSNARLLVHLPLIVPEGCGFRVGNQTRPWVPGQAWVFDDTIEHEAWNDSDKLRVILIFDIWHPALSEAERTMLTAMSTAMNAISGPPEGYGN
ncbi:aspartyl/asparaginyl beta-hydroxylase domain-containing protein [Ideonella sp. DXS29W]|uniref:Aspartyl/asparaginyl beta-hydroxylase domain-containing protein n=1 Tax=Ideonella lacteola TaxID=2984193 RepID=A0ABU9BS75_9BURK